MNIFTTTECPDQSARCLVDRHVIKQGLESTQMLCTAYNIQGIESPYKTCHINHPSSKWTRASRDNFQWLIEHAYSIFDEYTARYSKIHKSQAVLEWCKTNLNLLKFDFHSLTPFAVAIANDKICRTLPEFDSLSTTDKYRKYILLDKKHIHAWKRNRPDWIV